jgi:hypothetical protein
MGKLGCPRKDKTKKRYNLLVWSSLVVGDDFAGLVQFKNRFRIAHGQTSINRTKSGPSFQL